MFQDTKCECGHQNYTGTVLCEACGKPLNEEEGANTLLEMRYDGIARRSQRVNPSWIDRIWRFFSSVKVAVILIVITLIGSSLGTVFPQENTFINFDPSTYYKQTYGTIGEIYYLLGLSHTYSSWWFMLLLVMIGASLIICSLDRVLPLYRALSKQKIRKHLNFIRGQRVTLAADLSDVRTPQNTSPQAEAWVEQLAQRFRKRHYRVYTDGDALLAEKHRFSRWGPYINHIGLIIFLLAVLLRGIPGWYMDQYIGFLEGVPTPIPGTPYYLENEKFTVNYYKDSDLPKQFQGQGRIIPELYETRSVLYKCTADCNDAVNPPQLEKVDEHNIEVNHPLDYHGLQAYQFDYKETLQITGENVYLTNLQTGEEYGPVALDMIRPQTAYEAGPYHIEVKGYYPDVKLNDQGVFATDSNEARAPAFVFLIHGPGLAEDGDVYAYFPREVDKIKFSQDQLNGEAAKKLQIGVHSMEDVHIAQYVSYLNIRRDTALPYIFIGGIIFMIGVVMGLYWQHRRVWIRVDQGHEIHLGAHTNKNWYGLKHEVSSVLDKAGLSVTPKSLENKELKK